MKVTSVEAAGDRVSSASGAPREVLRAVHDKFGIEVLRKIKSGTWQVITLLFTVR